MRWVVLVLGMEFPAIVALLDCWARSPDQFIGGAEDRSAWLKWLTITLLLCPLLVGYGILLGYLWAVVKRNSPMTVRAHRD